MARKKRLEWIGKGTQTDFYDLPEYVQIAAERAAACLRIPNTGDAFGDGNSPERLLPNAECLLTGS